FSRDWSSDVCSSDLMNVRHICQRNDVSAGFRIDGLGIADGCSETRCHILLILLTANDHQAKISQLCLQYRIWPNDGNTLWQSCQIGRASGRERVTMG